MIRCLVFLSSIFLSSCGIVLCRTTLQTIPDSLTAEKFEFSDNESKLEVYSYYNVLYVGLAVCSQSKPVSLFEYATFPKGVGWKCVPNVESSHNEWDVIFFPLTAKLVETWNSKHKEKLFFSRYVSGAKNNEYIKKMGVKKASVPYDSCFVEAVVKEHNEQSNIRDIVLAPISFSCGIIDDVLSVPLTIISSAATFPIGIVYMPAKIIIGKVEQNNMETKSVQVEKSKHPKKKSPEEPKLL